MCALMKSVSGIRGIFGEDLTPENVSKFAAIFGNFCGSGKIIVARDSRTTGIAMLNAVLSGLISTGCKVVDLGITSTPTLLLAVKNHKANGGICITASHNPAMWNAMKFVDKNGMFLFPEKASKFIEALEKPAQYNSWDKMGTYEKNEHAIDYHLEKLLSIKYIDYAKIRKRNFKVALDNVNGAGGEICQKLLEKLNCRIFAINSEATGIFAHEPEPLGKNLIQLQDKVKEVKADIGFATDPDVDRLSIVNEKGDALGEEMSLILAEDYVLKHQKGDIVVNISSSILNNFMAEKYQVKLHQAKVGEINVGKKMLEISSPIGGEGNGGIICPEINYTRDAMAGIVLILALLSETEKSISEYAETFPKFFIEKDKLKFEEEKMELIMTRAKELADKKDFLESEKTLNLIDGIKIQAKDSWVHIRKSGTEPILRIYAEARKKEIAQEICRQTIAYIKN